MMIESPNATVLCKVRISTVPLAKGVQMENVLHV